MKKIWFLTVLILSVLLASCGKAKLDVDGCYIDMDEASKSALSKKKDILILATMENGDTGTVDFLNQVVRNASFKEDFLKNYIVIRMDFSEGINNYTGLLNLSMTPSVILLSKEQYYLGGFSCNEELCNYSAFKEAFDNIISEASSTKDLIAATKKGSALDKVRAIDNLYESTPEAYRPFLAPLLAGSLKLDKNNETGLRGKLIYAYVDAAALKAMSSGDIGETVRLYLTLENESLVEPEKRQQALYTAAYICAMTQTRPVPTILEYLQKAIDVYPEGPSVPGIKAVMEILTEPEPEQN